MNGYEPWEGHATNLWWWYSVKSGLTWLGQIPPNLFRHLRGGEAVTTLGEGRGYPTRQAALQALAVAMGRAEK